MASCVRRVGVASMLACAVAVSVAPVQAQERFRKDDLQQHPRDERGDRGDRNGQRFEQRDQRNDDAHRQQQDRNADVQRRSGRLTPDERRDLRRQINEAGVDLYPNTPRR